MATEFSSGSSEVDLLQLGLGYWSSKAFLAACDLKLFSVVEGGGNTLEEVASALSLPQRGTRFLLDGMTALGLLAKEGGRYRTTRLSSEYLVEGKPAYMGDLFVAVNRLFYAPFVEFERALRQDGPVWGVDTTEAGRRVPLGGEASEMFTRGMHGLSVGTGMAFGRTWAGRLAGKGHLLDVGGGSGVMAIGAVSSVPGLRATVLDRPEVCAVARAYISQAGLSHRIDTLEADMFTDGYPQDADVHLYSNVFHNYDADRCMALVRKSYIALPPQGDIVICDFVLEDSRTAPAFAAAFNFLALVVMEGGEAHTYGEYKAWLEGAGYVETGRAGLPGPATLVYGRKPAA